eukprot:TRINITY_DN69426_c0_g1_i1.p1 TRINITY_DN69426_c0_g1~~TRINITY_DN69426_c0_g1_i1.p1  ORF type:complete len:137 (-),score=31.04 TRINITY_DN69426_c0_g1_i1:248-658(-)
MQKASILEEIQAIDKKEEMGQMSSEEFMRRLILKEDFQQKSMEEEIKWRQRSRCKWLTEGDKNTIFFHGFAFARRRRTKLSLVDGEKRLEGKDEIVKHIEDYFGSLYSQEVLERPSLDNMEFSKLKKEEALWLGRV